MTFNKLFDSCPRRVCRQKKSGVLTQSDLTSHQSAPKSNLRGNFPSRAPQLQAAKLLSLALLSIATASAQQSPWAVAFDRLAQELTGPIARSLVLIGIVVTGMFLIFDTGGPSKRAIGNLVFGGCLVLGAAQFVAWLFT